MPASTSLRRSTRVAVAAISLIAVALLSAACIKFDVAIQLKDDGSGTVTVLTAFDTKAIEDFSKGFGGSSSSSSNPADDLTKVDTSKLPAGTTVEKYKDGKFTGAKVTAPFKSPNDIAAIVNQIAASDSGDSLASGGSSKFFEKFSLAKEGDSWKFSATIGSPTSGSGGDIGLKPEDLKKLFKDASFVFRLKFPGGFGENNADSSSNGELTWKLDIFAATPRTLTATSGSNAGGSGGGGDDFPILPVLGVVVIVLIAAGAFVMMRRKPAATV